MSSAPRRLVVGTAGHIDHGKTSMVGALTGVNLDSLPEEQERGITINLGFVGLQLEGGCSLAFIDVPGHERLVRTMIAGATGIDAVLLCVSAVDGVMPQTQEHLAILELLGVTSGAVVLTMADLVEPDYLELAREDVMEAVQGTFLQDAPIVAFSALTGDGKPDLLKVLQALESKSRPSGGAFRLPVDRVFTRTGFGTVVTGTSWSGELVDGDLVTLLPAEETARVRGLQRHGETVASITAGQRVAVNLAGIELGDAVRGMVVAKGPVPCTSIVDVRLRHLAGAPDIKDGDAVRFLHGTTERMGRLYLANEAQQIPPAGICFAQIRLEQPVACCSLDRFILRRPSPMTTLGGGVILDPWAPKMRNKVRVLWGEQLQRLEKGDVTVWLERSGSEGLEQAQWEQRLGSAVDGKPLGVCLGGRVFAAPVVARLEGSLLQGLQAFHEQTPLMLGAHRRELKRGRLQHMDVRAYDALVDRLARVGHVIVEGALLRIKGFEVVLSKEQSSLRQGLNKAITASGLIGLKMKALKEKYPQDAVDALLHLLEREEAIIDIVGLGWVGRENIEDLVGSVQSWFQANPKLTPGDFKQITGLSRKSAIPLLEWLDGRRITLRSGDHRVIGRAAKGFP